MLGDTVIVWVSPALVGTCGDAALYVSGDDPAELTAALKRIVTDLVLRTNLAGRASESLEASGGVLACTSTACLVRYACKLLSQVVNLGAMREVARALARTLGILTCVVSWRAASAHSQVGGRDVVRTPSGEYLYLSSSGLYEIGQDGRTRRLCPETALPVGELYDPHLLLPGITGVVSYNFSLVVNEQGCWEALELPRYEALAVTARDSGLQGLFRSPNSVWHAGQKPDNWIQVESNLPSDVAITTLGSNSSTLVAGGARELDPENPRGVLLLSAMEGEVWTELEVRGIPRVLSVSGGGNNGVLFAALVGQDRHVVSLFDGSDVRAMEPIFESSLPIGALAFKPDGRQVAVGVNVSESSQSESLVGLSSGTGLWIGTHETLSQVTMDAVTCLRWLEDSLLVCARNENGESLLVVHSQEDSFSIDRIYVSSDEAEQCVVPLVCKQSDDNSSSPDGGPSGAADSQSRRAGCGLAPGPCVSPLFWSALWALSIAGRRNFVNRTTWRRLR